MSGCIHPLVERNKKRSSCAKPVLVEGSKKEPILNLSLEAANSIELDKLREPI